MGVTLDHPTSSLQRAYDRLAVRTAWAVCVFLIILSGLTWVTDVTFGPVVRYVPLAVSILLFGLPHGAVDHLVPARLSGTSVAVSLTVVGSAYLLLGGLYAALWLTAPVPAALLFVAITWFHWGQGDVYALVAFIDADHLEQAPIRAATLIVRGGLPMLVPLFAFPDRYRAVVDSWVGLFGRDLRVAWLFAIDTRLILGALFLGTTMITLTAGYRVAGPSREWRIDAVETTLLWIFFLSVPPLIAVGVYFCLWHSLRHVLRLATLDDQTTSRGHLRSFARDAAPLTALALVLLVGFAFIVPVTPSNSSGLVALYLVFIAVVTLPHVLLVSWMDHREGVWYG